MNEILLFSGIQGLVLSVALVSKRGFFSKKSNIHFLALIGCVSLYLLFQALLGSFGNFPKLYMSNYLFIYLFTPFYFFFTKKLINPASELLKKNWWVFVPAITYSLLLTPFLILPNENFLQVLPLMNLLLWADIVAIIINIYIILICFNDIRTFDHKKSMYYALNSFQGAMLLVNAFWLFAILEYVEMVNLPFTIEIEEVFYLMSALVFLFGYFIIAKSDAFETFQVSKSNRYEKVNFEDREIQLIGNRILSYLKDEEAFLETDFKLSHLESKLNVNRFKLSYTLNNHLNTSFKSLINKYRIEKFLELVESKEFDHFNMFGIANEAGFKSKSTFYKAFKDYKGVTPKEYFDLEMKTLSSVG
ncbi:helix-turn-helix domain-containing protein [Ekhidna sp. To15]|uniref:helix-turn-helix domain-containing protein n=1 Tax=Ekhidna sp. To15 TaxID=3395267 RepID=UPI003F5253B8